MAADRRRRAPLRAIPAQQDRRHDDRHGTGQGDATGEDLRAKPVTEENRAQRDARRGHAPSGTPDAMNPMSRAVETSHERRLSLVIAQP